ncbi:gnat family acetyltransferase [Fusarium austroafricanum]|uniref:Gnat family acetyltransferase n=1 Tax=Fusarium austroafricanum TaxID=2364996 RepID=A0A8H4KUP8_9HYPO|nr:gnat family acetyltransferase [Fusarium austroafricanum]
MVAKNPKPKSSHKPVIIRRATIADAGRIAKLGAYVFTITFGHSVEPHELEAFLQEAYTEKAINKDLNDQNIDVIIATNEDNDFLGFAYLTRESSEPCVEDLEMTVELQRIYVDPSAHGSGVGKALEKRIEDMAREQGFKNLWLGVWEENPRALRAYEKWGYKQVGDHDFTIGSIVQTDQIMVKAL